jgi:hypothetical protein
MAGAFYRASGRPALLVTIPGPGFAYALPWAGRGEAGLGRADPPDHRGRRGTRGAFPAAGDPAARDRGAARQGGAARSGRSKRSSRVLEAAYRLALAGEPGPVVVELAAEAGPDDAALPTASRDPAATTDIGTVWTRLAAARRPLIYAGQGCLGSADLLRAWPSGTAFRS